MINNLKNPSTFAVFIDVYANCVSIAIDLLRQRGEEWCGIVFHSAGHFLSRILWRGSKVLRHVRIAKSLTPRLTGKNAEHFCPC